MSYRAGSKICRTDSVEESEFKASMAQIALFQAHIKHFTRVIALIDYATAHRVLGDVHHLYPLAFATGLLHGIDLDTISHDDARALARRIVDDMTLAIHESEWSRRPTPPSSADEAMLRRSRAVVLEDDTLQRLVRVGQLLRAFESGLRALPWSAYFTHPAPF